MIDALFASLALAAAVSSHDPVYDVAHAQGCAGQFAFLTDRDGRNIATLAPEESLESLTGDLDFWDARLALLADSPQRATDLRNLAVANAALTGAQLILSEGLGAVRAQVGGALAQCRADRSVIEAQVPAAGEPSDG
ncbi:MAG: hypothetical protein GC187_05235 [Alphaproteobacteria bacterium]|nr:hypothetical protein [Alphaproteobacteria bacterium]